LGADSTAQIGDHRRSGKPCAETKGFCSAITIARALPGQALKHLKEYLKETGTVLVHGCYTIVRHSCPRFARAFADRNHSRVPILLEDTLAPFHFLYVNRVSTPHWQRETPPGHTDWHSGHTTVRLRRPKDNPSQKAQHAKATEKARATKIWLGRSRKNSSPLRTRAAGEPASRQLRNPAATIATKKQHAVKTGVATFNSRRRRLAAAAVFSSSVILIHTGLAVALHLPPRPRRVERRNDARRYHSCRAESAGSSQVQAFCPASCLLFLLREVACCWQAALPKSDQRT